MSDLEAWKRNHDATVNSGAAAVRTALLINGGAAAAVLAFIGGIASQGRIAVSDINSIADALTWFGFGAFFAAVSNGLAYFANRSILTLSTRQSRPWTIVSGILQVTTICAVLASYAFFAIGLYEMRGKIGGLHLIDPPKSHCASSTT